METVQALLGGLFNAALVIMIVATMFNAGLSTTTKALGAVFRNIWLVILTLIVAFILRPLVGYGLVAILPLAAASSIVMILLACVPGAPLGVKFAMGAKADLTVAAALTLGSTAAASECTDDAYIEVLREYLPTTEQVSDVDALKAASARFDNVTPCAETDKGWMALWQQWEKAWTVARASAGSSPRSSSTRADSARESPRRRRRAARRARSTRSNRSAPPCSRRTLSEMQNPPSVMVKEHPSISISVMWFMARPP